MRGDSTTTGPSHDTMAALDAIRSRAMARLFPAPESAAADQERPAEHDPAPVPRTRKPTTPAQVLDALRMIGRGTARQVGEALGRGDTSSIRVMLQRMVDQGLVTRADAGPALSGKHGGARTRLVFEASPDQNSP